MTVYYQQNDVNGDPTAGDRVVYRSTDNTGAVAFGLTPGTYAVNVEDFGMLFNVGIVEGRITTTNGSEVRLVEE